MTDAPRVLFVITTLDTGGAEKHLLWLSQGLRARGYEIGVVYLKGEGSLAPQFRALSVAVDKIALDSMKGALGTVRRLASKIRDWRADLVHSHLLKADALCALACWRTGTPLVSSKHNEEPQLKSRVVGLLHGLLSRVPRRVIALSDYVLDYVATRGGVPRQKLRRVYYGIDPRRFESDARAATRAALGLEAGVHVALCVARFHPQKDHPTLFRAARRLAVEGRPLVLLLAGGDPFYGHRERLEALAGELELRDCVRFLGIRSDVPDLLAAADLFILPSLYEGLGLVFLEAMAASRPVLTTRSSAIPEVVVDGVTGRLVPVGDDAALAAAWGEFLRDPVAGARMGAAGRARVHQQFTLPRMIDETVAVYREALPGAALP